MKESLKQKLIDYLKTHGRMSVEQLEGVCHSAFRKTSNGEKRMRDLRAKELYGQPNPNFDPRIGVEMKNGAIIGYTYKTPQIAGFDVRIDPKVPENVIGFYPCCQSSGLYKDKLGNLIHSQSCIASREKVGKLL